MRTMQSRGVTSSEPLSSRMLSETAGRIDDQIQAQVTGELESVA